ncbi:regulatory protein RecX [Flavobacterium sp. CYK-55]|uniref:regulatory protein RecX n=1 Tax=Flavobacterium sp. CYK-55 TaxID=2835529 RepID=UPI0020BF25D2|nr:RecX family transcriptional regulator [Flavobacterium sp. CYK-55]
MNYQKHNTLFKKEINFDIYHSTQMGFSSAEIDGFKKKLEHYCVYQERCHEDLKIKMKQLNVPYEYRDDLMVYLIENNFLNEERFAVTFASGKHRIKHWGKIRISSELKFRNISSRIINTALQEISDEEYSENFNRIAFKIWEQTTEHNLLLKKKKCSEYLLRKGYESHWVYDKIQELSS